MTPEEKTVLEKLDEYSEYLYHLYVVTDDDEDRDIRYDMFRVVEDAADLITDLLTDRVKVVRCKDCKHYLTIHCTCDGCCISPDWYCADGEEK